MMMQNKKTALIEYNAFPGFSLAAEPASLSAGSLVAGSKNIDLMRLLGALSKRKGIKAQISSLGSTGIKCIHTYRTAGERVLFGHGTSLYRLIGEALDVAGSFSAGIFTQTEAVDNKLQLALDPESSEAITAGNEEISAWRSGTVIGQTFTVGPDAYKLTAIRVRIQTPSNVGQGYKLRLYTDPDKTELLAEKTMSFSNNQTVYAKYVFSSPVDVTPNTQYYFEITASDSWGLRRGTDYAGGDGYDNGTQTDDHYFQVFSYKPYYTSGDWLSPVYDLGSTPAVNTIEWNETLGSSTTVTIKVRGSPDNEYWGAWKTISTSGGGIPLTRYIQVQVFLTGGAYTPEVSNIHINYETSFTDVVELATDLSGDPVRFCDFDGVCYFTDGNNPQRYDGTSVAGVGVSPPSAAPTIAAGDAGNLTGDYYAKVTFVNSYGAESNAGPASTKLTVSSKKINWSNIPTGPAGTTARKLYRTKAGGSDYYFVATIGNNTAKTYTGDDTPDSDLITPLETDNDVPPSCSIVYEHNNYMLYASGNKLYFSKPKLPDSVPATAFKTFPGEILGVRTYQNVLIVSGERFTHAIVGNIWDKDPSIDNTSRVVISNSEGCVSHEGMVEIYTASGDFLVIPTLTGLKLLSPGYHESSLRTSVFTQDIQSLFADVANLSNICAVYDKDRLLVAMTYRGEDSEVNTNNIILVMDTRTMKWNPPWYINCAGFTHAFGKLYIGDSNSGVVHEFEYGDDDNGENIHAVAVLRPEYPSVYKRRFNHVRVGALPGSNMKTVKLKANVDGHESVIPLGTVNSWGNNISPKIKLNLPRGYEYQLTIEDNSKNTFSIPYIVTEFERGG